MEQTPTEIFKPHYLLVEQIWRTTPDMKDIERVEREWHFETAKQASEAFTEQLQRYKYGQPPQRVNSLVAEMSAEQITEFADFHVANDDEFMIHVYHVIKPTLPEERDNVVCRWYSKRENSVVNLCDANNAD